MPSADFLWLYYDFYVFFCSSLARQFFAELLGTFALVVFGDGAVAQVWFFLTLFSKLHTQLIR